jgi:DNA-directed RNA polymerase specialized sigma24 family protein
MKGRRIMNNPHTITELIELMANGDPSALECFYDQYEISIYHFALRFMHKPEHAENLVAEIFKFLWLEAGTFKTLQHDVDHWVSSICKKALLRKRKELQCVGNGKLSWGV